MTSETRSALDIAREQDLRDPLRRFREEFHIPPGPDGNPCVYLVGNSLGLQPRRTASFVQYELDAWRRLGVRAHFEGPFPWMPYHEFLAGPMAKLVGALPSEVVMMNSLTTNLHLMLATFYRPTPGRHAIALEQHAFPSDYHAAESQIRFHGGDSGEALLMLRPAYGKCTITLDDVDQLLEDHGHEIAVLLIPGVQYYTGQVFPVEGIVERAHRYGIVVGVDLAHAAGNIELHLHEWNVDFAVWCTYKYLNSGPGSVGGCFIHERHARNRELRRLAGWWGHDKETRFQMHHEFQAIPTAEGWQLSNPPILSLAAIRASLEVFEEAGAMKTLVEKSARLNRFLRQLIATHMSGAARIVTAEPAGCQTSLEILAGPEKGRQVHEELVASGIEVDWREPNVLRVAPVPLYNSFEDVYRFAEALSRLLIVEASRAQGPA